MSDENKPTSSAEGATEAKVDAPAETVDPVAAITAERDRYKDAALRALADLDNYRKRAVRERDEYSKKAREDLLRELLPVFDNLERAQQFVGQGADVAAIGKGVEMVLKLFEDTLVRVGGKRLRPVGEAFDPQVHEAIAQQPSEMPAGVVAAEAAAGYMLGDRLLRAAMVVVSTGPAPKPVESKPAEEEQLEFDPSKG
ncbi:MAG: nucleotide exchange factor GrpE [Myxococcales bacterium]|nr:nucleotide exchange factor GrpE [Myxococcales bacterium]